MEAVPLTRIACLVAAPLLLAVAGCGAPSSTTRSAAPGTIAPQAAAADCAPRRAELLRAINAARATARRCGSRAMAAAPPLRWNAQLDRAAEAHSRDMAARGYFDHRSPGGESVRERVRAQNYPWRNIGENIAGGTETIDDTVRAWTDSPSHCENLMEPDYQEFGAACVQRPGTEFRTYWTLVLARR